MPKVLSQGDMRACALNSLANALNFHLGNTHLSSLVPVSRLFLYHFTRMFCADFEDRTTEDTGCAIDLAASALNRFGTCSEKTWPYERKQLGVAPSPAAMNEALALVGTKMARIDTLIEKVLDALAEGRPVIVGMAVCTNMGGARKSGELSMPTRSDSVIGNHAVLACGYDINKRVVTMQNCWGPTWGANGYFTVPFEYFDDPDLVFDTWVLVLPVPVPVLPQK